MPRGSKGHEKELFMFTPLPMYGIFGVGRENYSIMVFKKPCFLTSFEGHICFQMYALVKMAHKQPAYSLQRVLKVPNSF